MLKLFFWQLSFFSFPSKFLNFHFHSSLLLLFSPPTLMFSFWPLLNDANVDALYFLDDAAILSLTPCPLPPSANYVLPDAGECLDEVIFIELQREEADALIKQYNEEGRKAGPPPEKRFDTRPGGFRGRGFQRYEHQGAPQGARGSYQNRGSSGGGGYRGGNGPGLNQVF